MGIIAAVVYWSAFAGGMIICIAALLSIKKKNLQDCKNAFDAGVSHEREACARVCDERMLAIRSGSGWRSMFSHDPASVESGCCADAIRARSRPAGLTG